MNLIRWNDDRLDDLAALTHANDGRLDRVAALVSKHDEDLKQVAKTGDRRVNRNWQLTLALFTVTATAIANLLIALLK